MSRDMYSLRCSMSSDRDLSFVTEFSDCSDRDPRLTVSPSLSMSYAESELHGDNQFRRSDKNNGRTKYSSRKFRGRSDREVYKSYHRSYKVNDGSSKNRYGKRCDRDRSRHSDRSYSRYEDDNRHARSKKMDKYGDRQRPRYDDLPHANFIPHITCNNFQRDPRFSELPLEWWEREEDCKLAKEYHTQKIDYLWPSREDLVLQTTLANSDTVLEPNMFPYATPRGIAHYTLWSVFDLTHNEIIHFVDNWLKKHFPAVRRWQYDDNSGERSILLFHVHVFVEMDPFSFTPRPGLEYFPPHLHVS